MRNGDVLTMADINPYDKAHELARAITASEIYRNYIAAKDEVKKNPEVQARILKLREMQMEVNRAQIIGEKATPEKVQEVTVEFARLSQIKAAAQFLNAEGAFIQMFTDIQGIIQQSIEKDFQ